MASARDTVTLILYLSLLIAQSKQIVAIVVFLEVTCAYDRVYHEAIYSRVRSSGLDGRMYAWSSEYLRDSAQW